MLLLLLLFVTLALSGYQESSLASGQVTVTPNRIPIFGNQVVLLSGVGFQPNTPVRLETVCPNGIPSEITYLAGAPVTDSVGAFSTKWVLDRWGSMIITPGTYPLRVRVGEREVVAQLIFVEPRITILPHLVPIDPNTTALIRGTGFPPNQPVTLITYCPNGIPSDITYLAGATATDSHGTFSVNWVLERWGSTIISPGTYPFTATVGSTRVTVPIVFVE